MKKINSRVITQIYVFSGIALLLIGTLILALWQWNIHSWAKKTQTYVETLSTLIPEPQGAVLEERMDNIMPVLSVDQTDFVGILEMPEYQLSLPVCADWGHVTKYPCKFNGSLYDRSMQIGATTQKGQFDFYREISVGDTVIFTDAQGNRYTYAITNLRYTKHVDQTTLNQQEDALTLFIKNIYDFDYLIVSCDVFD